MPAARRQDVRASEARERLLAATLRCAARDGGGALSLQSIAEEASVSKALVLYHYQDKERLLATTIRWLTGRLRARSERAGAEHGRLGARGLLALAGRGAATR
ncbi:MAG: TetR family transcriptional regulator [Gemmatimonadetes bacterium]|nr:TetR family transcriptional regulator [Gemmatimonadota bacterium]